MTARGRLSLLYIWRSNNLVKKIKGEDGKIYAQKKPLHQKWWIWLVAVLILGMASMEGTRSTDDRGNAEVASAKIAQEPPSVSDELIEEGSLERSDIPDDYKSALSEAETYSKSMLISKKGLHDHLTSEYGEQFSPEAAQYALDNVKTDWKENALQSAEIYA